MDFEDGYGNRPDAEEDLRAGRKLVDPSKAEKFRGGLDIPFPGDFASPEKESPEGERRVAERVNATGQEPTKEKEPEDATDGTTDGATDGTGDGEKKDG